MRKWAGSWLIRSLMQRKNQSPCVSFDGVLNPWLIVIVLLCLPEQLQNKKQLIRSEK